VRLGRTGLAAAGVACIALVAGAVVLLDNRGEDHADHARSPAERLEPAPEQPARQVRPQAPAVRPPFGAQLARRTQLRASPGGRVMLSLGMFTGYGSARVMAVVGHRGRWLAVLSDHLPNSRRGWIPRDAVTLIHEPYTLHADVSERELVVRHERRVVRRIRVAVGLSATPTPTGHFAVTDVLRITGPPTPYGCCALALTGRQPDVPQGWSGSDRLAIHGTTNEATVGNPASYGCMRARERDMRWLIAHVPVGAPLRIRA
jgi:lipoprotein-anchoring transpeptidase ErfK/SrfK